MSSVCAAAPPATNSGVHGASPSSSPSMAELCPVLSLTHTYVCINPSVRAGATGGREGASPPHSR